MTPAEAVRHGERTVNGAVTFCMFGLPLICGVAALALGLSGAAALWAGLAATIPCWVLAWLAWAMLVPRWRVWAYERVEDLDELRWLAFERQLLWPEGHFLERTELRTAEQRRLIRDKEATWARRRPARTSEWTSAS